MNLGRVSQFLGFVLMGTFLAAGQALGAGFALYEGSARGNALGGGLVGRADDPSAIFFNPAGITQLPGLQVMAGATAIVPSTDVVIAGNSYSTRDNVWVPPHLYATYQFSDSLWFGLGAFGAFGLGTEFDEDWPGRYNNYEANIKTMTVNPNLAFKLNEKVSAAVGLNVMWFDLDLRNKIATPLGDVDQTLQGDSFGYGYNLALRYRPCDWVAMGVSYRSRIGQRVKGDADFTRPALLSQISPGAFNDTGASGYIILPDMVFMGLTFYPMERLSLEAGAVWSRWSTYKDLTIRYDNPITVNPVTGLPVTEVTRVKNWRDVWRLNFSAEYKALDWLDLRAGYIYDEEPSPDAHVDYLVPANDRHLFSFGPGFHWNKWDLDLSYTYLLIKDRDVTGRPQEGVFDSEFKNGDAHLFGVSLAYKF